MDPLWTLPPSVLPYETRRFKTASCLSGRLSRIYTTHAKQSTYNRGFLSELNGVKRRSVQERISVGCVFIILFLLPSLDSFIRSSKLSNQHNPSTTTAQAVFTAEPQREKARKSESESAQERARAHERENNNAVHMLHVCGENTSLLWVICSQTALLPQRDRASSL